MDEREREIRKHRFYIWSGDDFDYFESLLDKAREEHEALKLRNAVAEGWAEKCRERTARLEEALRRIAEARFYPHGGPYYHQGAIDIARAALESESRV